MDIKTPAPEIPKRYQVARTSKKCKTCLFGRNNPAFRARLYKAWFDRSPGEETLEMIGKEMGISNQAIYRHAHNHMRKAVKRATVTERSQLRAEEIKAQAMKDLEVSFDHAVVVPKEEYEQAVDQVIADGLVQLKQGNKDITINQLLAAAKLKGEWKLKKRGQDAELIKMMYRSASGFTADKSPDLGNPGTN